jgi:hypothetical protein
MWIWRLPLVYFFPSLFIADVFAASPICYNIDQVKVTFYGYPDNSPVGPDIRCALDSREDCTGCASNSSHTTTAEECGPRGETAGGTGTYDDPITMASAATWFCYQEIIYLPYLQKYLRYEDYCADCTADAAVGILHIDIWTGSTTVNGGAIQDKCEKMLTPTGLQPMIRNPNIGLPVDCECMINLYSRSTNSVQPPSSSTPPRRIKAFVMERQ